MRSTMKDRIMLVIALELSIAPKDVSYLQHITQKHRKKLQCTYAPIHAHFLTLKTK